MAITTPRLAVTPLTCEAYLAEGEIKSRYDVADFFNS